MLRKPAALVALVSLTLVAGATPGFAITNIKAELLSTADGKPVGGSGMIGEDSMRFLGKQKVGPIPLDSVTKITAGEFAKRRVKGSIIGAVLLSPVALFALIGKKKREMFAVEYTNEEGGAAAMVFQVKKKIGFTVENALEVATGVEVEWEERGSGSKKKKNSAEAEDEADVSDESRD